MKIITIANDINSNMVEHVINQVKGFPSEPETVKVMFDSDGGTVQDITSLSIIFDDLKSNGNKIEFYANGRLYSAAFMLFFQYQCDKRVIGPYTRGIAHAPTFEMIYSTNLKPGGYLEFRTNCLWEITEFGNDFMKKIMPPHFKQLDGYLKGDDVYFFRHELIEICEYIDRSNLKQLEATEVTNAI